MKKFLLVSEFSNKETQYFYADSFFKFISRNQKYRVTKFNTNKPSWLGHFHAKIASILNIFFEFYLSALLIIEVEKLKPDVIFLLKAEQINFRAIRYFYSKNICIFNFYPDSPFSFYNGNSNSNILQSLPFYETFFCWNERFNYSLQTAGARKIKYLPFFADQELFYPETMDPKYDISFVGAWDKKREDMLNIVAQAFADKKIFIAGPNWQNSTSETLKPLICHKSLTQAEMRTVFCQTKINFNILKEQNKASINMRTFEIPSCGAFMLSEDSIDQKNYFESNVEAGYFNEQNLTEKINFYLKNDNERSKIAKKSFEKNINYSLSNLLENLV